jgi:hypothetical protein
VVTAFWCLAAGQAVVGVIWWAVYIDHARHADAGQDDDDDLVVAPAPAGP